MLPALPFERQRIRETAGFEDVADRGIRVGQDLRRHVRLYARARPATEYLADEPPPGAKEVI